MVFIYLWVLKDDRDRTVIYKLDVHHCLKSSGLNIRNKLASFGNKELVKAICVNRVSRVDVGRSPAFSRIGVQCELGHDKQTAFDVLNGMVHLPVFVVEDPKL